MTDVAEAYSRCEEITRAEARNFSYGIRLLPRAKRQAMSALYAFARRVDDIGDGEAEPAKKLEELSFVRDQLNALEMGGEPIDDPVLIALGDAYRHYPIEPDALRELVSGCEMDCRKQRYESFDDLVVYCRCVAGSIGRLSLQIFGSTDERAPILADTLGVALQVTNILRDIVEDREVMGRVYLPAEDLRRFGCALDATGEEDDLVSLVRFEAGRAKQCYEEGLKLLSMLDSRSRACVGAMAGIYRRLLERIERDPRAVFDHRVSLPVFEKIWVSLCSLSGAMR